MGLRVMKRDLVVAVIAAVVMPFCLAEQRPPRGAAIAGMEKESHAAIQINELAGNVHSLADARNYVNAVAKEFADDLPPAWTTVLLRERVAQAEYRAASSPTGLIPEQRVADAWNRFVNEIGAPNEALVTVAVIHNLRDADYASSRVMWARGIKDIWTVPNLYALDSGGKVASGCRPVEALKVLWEMANQPEKVSGARERVKKGVLASDLFKQQQKKPASGHTRGWVTTSNRPEDPIEAAERHYVSEHGIADFSRVVEEMIGKVLPLG